MENEFPCIVERILILQDHETGQKGEIRLAVGQPFWIEPGFDAACPVAVYGYVGRLADIRGIDPMSAVALAIKFLESLLDDLPKSKTITWPSGEPY
jgi:hypothetical protein